MKIFSYNKTDKLKQVLLFKFLLYEVKIENNYKIQNFLGAFFSTKKTIDDFFEEKLFKFCNFEFLKIFVQNNISNFYLFNILICKISLIEKFYNKHLKKIEKNYDDIYILNANSGEIFLIFAFLIKNILKKHNSQKPLFITTKKYHKDIIKLYLPFANVIVLNKMCLKTNFTKLEIFNHRCFLLFPRNYYSEMEEKIKNSNFGEEHYFNSIIEYLKLDKNSLEYSNINYDDKLLTRLLKKINKNNINLSNFVILAPEAITCEELSENFWQNLIKELRNRNIDVFFNKIGKKYNFKNLPNIRLSYQEIYVLATMAKAIISLRSGLSEFLLPTGIPNLTIYTKFRQRLNPALTTEKILKAFSMTKIPCAKIENIKEFNFESYENENALLKDILKNFDELNTKKEECVL